MTIEILILSQETIEDNKHILFLVYFFLREFESVILPMPSIVILMISP